MIGIAMTTYNGEKYLKEQIDSILNHLGFLKNFEKAIRICLDRGAEYVALSDQDDVWTDDYLMVLSNILKVNPDIDIAYGKRLNFTSNPPPPLVQL